MQAGADQRQAPTAIRTNLGAIFVALELRRSTFLITSLSPGGGSALSQLQERARVRTGQTFPIIVIQEAASRGLAAMVAESLPKQTILVRRKVYRLARAAYRNRARQLLFVFPSHRRTP